MVTMLEGRSCSRVTPYEARAALSRAGQGMFGTPAAGQSQAGTSRSVGFLRTLAAVAGILDLGPSSTPTPGHSSRVTVKWSSRDETTGATAYGTIEGGVKNVAGVLTIVDVSTTLAGSDNATSAATLTTAGPTLEITATPPAGFADALDWKFEISVTPN
jgi:hypothetical protein